MDSKILKALGIDPALIFIFLLILIVILFVLYVNVTMKYNRLKSSYTTFMRGKDGKTLEEEVGDLLLAVVNMSRKCGVDPNLALDRANRKFYNRFGFVEKSMTSQGVPMERSQIEEMKKLWKKSKSEF